MATETVKQLSDILMGIGGTGVVEPDAFKRVGQTSFIAPLIPTIIKDGQAFNFPVVMRLGKPNSCHWNVAELLFEDAITAVGTGYALSADGLWREHSWGLDEETIIETTEERDVYFGLPFSAGKEACTFVKLLDQERKEK